MGARQRAPAPFGEDDHLGRLELFDAKLELHVPQLADVEMPAAAVLRPAQEDVASRLHEPVPLHYPLPVVGINARARIGFQDRGARFLDLEEEGVLCARHQQRDAADGADASDAHHLDGLVLEGISVQEDTPVVRQRFAVASKNILDPRVEIVLPAL